MEITEGQVVLCTIKKIEKATVFLEIEDNGEGSMVLSEVAAGRIRNLRQYVAPNKKVVCKILNIENGNIQLSLRRVTAKERAFVLEKYKKERNFYNMLKTIIKNTEQIFRKIKQSYDLTEFLEEAQNNKKLLIKYFTEEEAEKLFKILAEKEEKIKKVKKIFTLTSNSPTGLLDIKEILAFKPGDIEIRYLASSKFSITTQAKDFKEAEKKISEALEEIEKRAKQKHAHFQLKEK